MVAFAAEAHHRLSKRGLVLAGLSGQVVLFEHPRALQLPDFLSDDPTPETLVERLGPPLQDGFVEELVSLGVLTSGSDNLGLAPPTGGPVTFDRHGILFRGIATPSAWIDKYIVPIVVSWPGRAVVAALLVAGFIALLSGRPDIPAVAGSPAIQTLLIILVGMLATVLHEFGHAVALVHFGGRPQRAGVGFYWGAVSFFVDSTPALVLPRRQRVVQALAGLMVDTVTASLLLLGAHVISDPLTASVLWTVAVFLLLDLVVNVIPVLEVDGHWALADWLDEPDLSPRARRALGLWFRRRLPEEQRLLAGYGAFSLVGGIGILALSIYVIWQNVGDLMVALFTGNAVDVAVGIYYVVPVILGLLFSAIGLILETLQLDSRVAPEPSVNRPAP